MQGHRKFEKYTCLFSSIFFLTAYDLNEFFLMHQVVPFDYLLQDTPYFVIDGEPLSINDCIWRLYEIKWDFEELPKTNISFSSFQKFLNQPGKKFVKKTFQTKIRTTRGTS